MAVSRQVVRSWMRCMDPDHKGEIVKPQAFLSYLSRLATEDDRERDNALAAEIGCGASTFFGIYRRKTMLDALFEGGSERDALVKQGLATEGRYRARLLTVQPPRRRFDDVVFTKRMRLTPREETPPKSASYWILESEKKRRRDCKEPIAMTSSFKVTPLANRRLRQLLSSFPRAKTV